VTNGSMIPISARQEISSLVAALFEFGDQLGDKASWDMRLAHESHVVRRVGDLGIPFFALVFCEDARCIYKVFYDECWKDRWLADFLSWRVSSVATQIRLVAGTIAFVDQPDAALARLWEQAQHPLVTARGMMERQPINAYRVCSIPVELVRFDAPDEQGRPCFFFIGIEGSLVDPYRKALDQVAFELFCDDPIVRVVERESGEVLAVLPSLTTFRMDPETYQSYQSQAGYIWNDEADEVGQEGAEDSTTPG
jgi:hypothetical protein